jgi:hypothetical protein
LRDGIVPGSDNHEILLLPPASGNPAIQSSSIQAGCGALPVPAIAHTPVGHELQAVFLGKYLTKEIERWTQASPDDHQVGASTLRVCNGVSSIEETANCAARSSKPGHLASLTCLLTQIDGKRNA